MKNNSLLRTINDIMLFLKIVMVIIFISYCFSGLTNIKPGEIGLVLRFGKLVGFTKDEQIHKAGWIYTFPFPIDTLIRVPLKEIREIELKEVACTKKNEYSETIDPLNEGYCISGDENIFQVDIIVKYQISDPVDLMTNFMNSMNTIDKVIDDIVISQMTQLSARFSIDSLLSEKKKKLAYLVKESSQERLNKINSGISIISIEFKEFVPPLQIRSSFEEVNTAAINRVKDVNTAKSYREEMMPRAKAKAQQTVDEAYSYKEEKLALAIGESNSFLEKLEGYNKNSVQIKKDLINSTRIKVLSKLKDLIVLPPSKDCEAEIWTYLKGSDQTTDPYNYIDQYEGN